MRHAPHLAALVVTIWVVGLGGCGPPDRGTKRTGDPCGADLECAHGMCVGGVAGPAPACTVSCGSTEDCPRGWSCSGVTGDRVLVCARGHSTPFGVGARE